MVTRTIDACIEPSSHYISWWLYAGGSSDHPLTLWPATGWQTIADPTGAKRNRDSAPAAPPAFGSTE
jgi:hypothetical protein